VYKAFVVPLIQTPRLVLRGLGEDDVPFLLEHFGRSEINEYSADDNVKNLEEAKELYLKYIAPTTNRFRLGLLLDDKLIGTVGFYGIDHENGKAIAGADLMKEYWGKGLMTEALQALIDYGFEQMNLNRIDATSDPENSRSIRLMERCGFRREGLLRQRFYYKASFHDEAIYSLLKEDWRAMRLASS